MEEGEETDEIRREAELKKWAEEEEMEEREKERGGSS